MNAVTTPGASSCATSSLWPVAVLLLAALVAVPVLLALSPSRPRAPPVAVNTAADDGIAEPIVAKVRPRTATAAAACSASARTRSRPPGEGAEGQGMSPTAEATGPRAAER